MSGEVRRAIGLMSGTSLDGIDVAFLETDGRARVTPGPALTVPYEEAMRTRLRSVLGGAARTHFPAQPRRWLVTGGGRHNPALMVALSRTLRAPVEPVEGVGWDGDALEAQAFAYLAVRSLDGLPLSFPGTTG